MMLGLLLKRNIKYSAFLTMIMVGSAFISPAMSEKKPECEICVATFTKDFPACIDEHKCYSAPPGCVDGCVGQEQSKLHFCYVKHKCPESDYPRLDLEKIGKDLANQAGWGMLLHGKGK